jgi:phospholipase/carboxylesterase
MTYRAQSQSSDERLAGFVYRFIPAQDAAKSVETFLLLHGTGGDENDLLSLGQMLAGGRRDVALLSPRGQALESAMPRFFRRLAEGVFDKADLIRRTHELAAFIERATQRYTLDEKGVTAIGFSNGANIAASILLLRPGLLRRAVLFHAMVPLVPGVLPDLSGTSVFLGAGRLDPIVPTENTEQLAAMLSEAGAEVELFWHMGGHSLTH